jgi:hypothetical protein
MKRLLYSGYSLFGGIIFVLFVLNSPALGADRHAVASTAWNLTTTWLEGIVPVAGDNVYIGYGGDSDNRQVTIPSGYTAECSNLYLGNAVVNNQATVTLTLSSSTSELHVSGNAILYGPAGSGNRLIAVDDGKMTIGGNLELGTNQEGSSASRYCKITILSGTVTVSGNLTFNNIPESDPLQTQIVFSGAGVFNLAGTFTINHSLGTLTPSTGTFNFNGSSSPQTVPVGVSNVIYNNLHLNNTSAGGANLSAAITSAYVTGNIRVQSGTLNNGGFAIGMNASTTFEVANSSTFTMTGTSGMVTGTSITKTFGISSTLNYGGTSQTVSAESYGNLKLSGSGTKTMPGSDLFLGGNFTMDGTASATAGGNFKIAGDLVINPGSQLIIPALKNLTVNGSTTINSLLGLQLKSNASGTASFLDHGISGTGTVKVERYLTTDSWHYISSPITNATAAVFLDDYLMTSDPTTSTGWSDYIINPATPLQVMRGYAVWKPSTNTRLESFIGTTNTGNQTFTGNRTATDPFAGWHMVGNPYPSAINLSTGITWDHFEKAAYFWNQAGSGNPLYSSGNYNVALASPPYFGTHTKYAPTEQGFFVHISDTWSGNSTLTFTNAARVHNTETFLKDDPEIHNALLMTALSSINNYSDRISIHFNPGATASYDPGYDAYKLWGLYEAPQLYTRIGDTLVTCNSLPFELKNMVIPMGFSCGLPGMYTLIADSLGTFDDAISVSLEDLKLNTTRDLKTNPVYNFTYDTIDDANRFLLHFDNPTLGERDLKNIRPVQIYSFGSSVYIRSTGETNPAGDIFIYDMTGREFYRGRLSVNPLNRFTPVIANGYYVVKVVTGDAVYSGKIYLAD